MANVKIYKSLTNFFALALTVSETLKWYNILPTSRQSDTVNDHLNGKYVLYHRDALAI